MAALARARNASLFMVLAAAVKVLLHRYTAQEDILLGFPIAGRSHPDLENQVGFYVNMLPLRDSVRADAPFLDLLDSVRTTATEAYDHQGYPFDRLVDELDIVRDVSRSPMFDVIVVMQNAGPAVPALGGLTVRPFIRGYEPPSSTCRSPSRNATAACRPTSPTTPTFSCRHASGGWAITSANWWTAS